MTNREWLLNKMQNMSDDELSRIIRDCGVCELVEFDSCCGNNCKFESAIWLKAEHKEKITLSEAERIILENINKEYSYIARNQNGDLEVFLGKPFKATVIWNSRGFKYCYLTCFNHLFQFITWEDEQAYNIAELLKGE
jgi:hypothetical protein